MTKHTEGPWWRFGGMVDGYGITSDNETILEQGCDGLRNEANANLIAAAPDLLDACEDLIDLVEVLIRYPYPEAVAKEVHVVKEAETFEAVVKAKEAIKEGK